MSDPGYDSEPDTPLRALEGVARLTAGAWVRTASWGLGASIRMARAATDPRQALELVQEFGDGVRGYTREVLGVADLDRRVAQLMPGPDEGQDGAPPDDDALRAAGAELLRRSTDVDSREPAHPAFARMLEELAPDEARILRLMATDGPQAAVDVRSTHLLGVGSQIVAEGLTMIGPRAGCRNVERVPSYLNNLNRLGLIWFSKEPIDDPIAYQVLEAQPGVLTALKSASRTKTVQRSIGLTPFGRDFCQAALPVETGEIDALEADARGRGA